MFFFLLPLETQEERWEWFMAHLSDKEIQALFREAYRILRNKEDAEDVLQEALLKGAVKCYQLQDEKKLFQWMFSIVRREATAHYRRFSLHTIWIQAKLKLLLPTKEDQDVEQKLQNDYDRQCLKQALEHLKSPAKDIVYLHIAKDMNFPEIAKALNMNYHTVRSRYTRTLHEIQADMERISNE